MLSNTTVLQICLEIVTYLKNLQILCIILFILKYKITRFCFCKFKKFMFNLIIIKTNFELNKYKVLTFMDFCEIPPFSKKHFYFPYLPIYLQCTKPYKKK